MLALSPVGGVMLSLQPSAARLMPFPVLLKMLFIVIVLRSLAEPETATPFKLLPLMVLVVIVLSVATIVNSGCRPDRCL